jgi:hypothetical protein
MLAAAEVISDDLGDVVSRAHRQFAIGEAELEDRFAACPLEGLSASAGESLSREGVGLTLGPRTVIH